MELFSKLMKNFPNISPFIIELNYRTSPKYVKLKIEQNNRFSIILPSFKYERTFKFIFSDEKT